MIDRLAEGLRGEGFVRVMAAQMQGLLGEEALAGWEAYARTWDDLAVDAHMADGGRYRRRRFASFSLAPGAVARKPHQPHYQSLDYNRLNGGVERWFEPVTEAVANHPITGAVLRTCLEAFGRAAPEPGFPWHGEMHQFRIEARPGKAGQPTPEGVHRDGVDWVLVMLVARNNIEAGVTSIFDPAGASLGAFTLAEPLDAVFLDDTRVFHGVTAIEPADPARPAYRDVLVVTFRKTPSA